MTSEASRIEIAGGHEHRRENPNGNVFHFGCFREAPGCAQVGAPSRYFAWFSGYDWQISNCRACRAHLGWRFGGNSDHFFGLILSQLVSLEDDGPSVH